jgi:hypothetical protein
LDGSRLTNPSIDKLGNILKKRGGQLKGGETDHPRTDERRDVESGWRVTLGISNHLFNPTGKRILPVVVSTAPAH